MSNPIYLTHSELHDALTKDKGKNASFTSFDISECSEIKKDDEVSRLNNVIETMAT